MFLNLRKSPELAFDACPYRRDLEQACAGLGLEQPIATYVRGFHQPHRVPPEVEARLEPAAPRLDPPVI